ncbi:hypothetical protein GN956_G25461 [Arapaima gigas]
MFTAQAGKVHVASFFLSLLLFSLTVAQQQCDVSAVAGDTVVIPLGYPGFTRNNDLTWKRDWVTVFQTRQGQVFVGAAGDVTGNGSLILPNVQKYQAGVYSATVLDVRPYFAQMTLCVQGQPPEAVYGLTGEEVELDPKVREPLVSITWNKVLPIADWYTGGIQSYYYRCAAVNQCDLSLTTGVLKMKGLKAEDDGRYSVEINMKGIAREFDLVVLGSSSHSTAAIVLSVLVAVAVVAALAGTYFKINPCRCLRRLKNRRVEPCGQATTPEQEAAPENNSGSSDRRETSSPVVLCSKRSFSHPHVSRIV